MRYAAIDIGSNSCRLLIAEIKDDQLNTIYRQLETTRIAAGLNHTGKISPEVMERTLLCLEDFRHTLVNYGVNKYRAFATSAVREAGNSQDFIKLADERYQLKIDVISGHEEARLSYLGVKKGLALKRPPLVVDLGGGSTEFICAEQDFILSIPLGAVRATEMNMTAGEIVTRLADVEKIADDFRSHPLVMVGGTASSLAAIKSEMEIFDSELVHGQILKRQDIADLYQLLDRMPLSLRKRLPGLQAERADIIAQGALIILMIVDLLKKSKIIVCETDLLQGSIWLGDSFKNI